GGRLSEFRLSTTMQNALVQRFGPGKWLLPGPVPTPYLNLELIRKHKLDPADVERVAADAALTEPHIVRAYTRHDLLKGGEQPDAIGRAISLGFFGPRSGDVYILPEPYYLFETSGTSHGTPYDYDNHVPLIFFGPGIKAGIYAEKVAVNDAAPTLSMLLGV